MSKQIHLLNVKNLSGIISFVGIFHSFIWKIDLEKQLLKFRKTKLNETIPLFRKPVF